MENKKNLLVLVGKKKIINEFKKLNLEHFNEENTIFLQHIDNLKDQINFIVNEEEFSDKNNIILELTSLDNELLEKIKDITNEFEDVYHKFLFLFDEGEQPDHNVHLGKDNKIMKHISNEKLGMLTHTNSLLMLNIDVLNYYIEMLKIFYGIKSHENMKEVLPSEILDLIEGSFIIIGDKIQQENERV